MLGARESELAEEDLRRAPRRSAGRCGPAPPPRSPAARWDTAAALMNCGRFPTTVRTRTAAGTSPLQSSAAAAASSRSTRCWRRACASLVTGPGADGSSMSSTAAIGITSRTVEAMNASSAARTSSSVHGRSLTSHSSSSRARVIEARMRSSSGGVHSVAARDPEERPGRALEHAPVRGHEQALVEALLLRESAREHVAGVGERLEAVEDAVGRVGDRRHARDRRARRQRLDDRDPPPAAGQDDAQEGVDRAGGLEQGVELAGAARRGRPPAAGLRRCGAAGRRGRRARTGGRRRGA